MSVYLLQKVFWHLKMTSSLLQKVSWHLKMTLGLLLKVFCHLKMTFTDSQDVLCQTAKASGRLRVHHTPARTDGTLAETSFGHAGSQALDQFRPRRCLQDRRDDA